MNNQRYKTLIHCRRLRRLRRSGPSHPAINQQPFEDDYANCNCSENDLRLRTSGWFVLWFVHSPQAGQLRNNARPNEHYQSFRKPLIELAEVTVWLIQKRMTRVALSDRVFGLKVRLVFSFYSFARTTFWAVFVIVLVTEFPIVKRKLDVLCCSVNLMNQWRFLSFNPDARIDTYGVLSGKSGLDFQWSLPNNEVQFSIITHRSQYSNAECQCSTFANQRCVVSS